jgi:hypothetical protein
VHHVDVVVGEHRHHAVGELGVELGGDHPGRLRGTAAQQAAPTPQPVPHSAMVPDRVAAKVASSRPVSVREAWTYPRSSDIRSARTTRSGVQEERSRI